MDMDDASEDSNTGSSDTSGDGDIEERLRQRLKEMIDTRESLNGNTEDHVFITNQIKELVRFMEQHSICLGVEKMPPLPPTEGLQGGATTADATAIVPAAAQPQVPVVGNAIVNFVARVTSKRRREATQNNEAENEQSAGGAASSNEDEEDEEAPDLKKGRK